MGTVVEEKRKSGKVFRAEVRLNGGTDRITKRFRRKTDAKAWISNTETKIRSGEHLPIRTRFTIADVIDKYIVEALVHKKASTQKLQGAQLRWFREKLGSVKLCQLTPAALSSTRDLLRQEKYVRRGTTEGKTRSASTLNRYFQPLMHCLHVARDEWGWIRDVPRLKKLRENPARTAFYTPDEIRAVLAKIERNAQEHLDVEKRKDRQLSERMNLLIARLALHTGARLHEICSLRWGNVDLLEGIIRFAGTETKTGHDRDVPLPDALRQDLIAWRGTREQWSHRFTSDYLFPALQARREGKRWKGHRSDFASKVFRAVARELGIVGKTFHDIRHTAATWATRQGVPTRTVQSLLGHQKISTTERYSHTMMEGQREAVEAISAMLDDSTEEAGDEIH